MATRLSIATFLAIALVAGAAEAGKRAQVRLAVTAAHRERLLKSGRVEESRVVARRLRRMFLAAGKTVDAEWMRRNAEVFPFEREQQNSAPFTGVSLEQAVRMAEAETKLAERRKRGAPVGRNLTRLARMYQESNMLQEAAWALEAAGPRHAPAARVLERRLERVLRGRIVKVHHTVMDGRHVRLVEFPGEVFAVWKPAEETSGDPKKSRFPATHAYRVDRLLGIGAAPVTVTRSIDGAEGSLQYFFRYGSTLKQRGFGNRTALGDRLRDLARAVHDPDGHTGNAFMLPMEREAAIDLGQAFYFNFGMDGPPSPELARRIRQVDRTALRRALGAPLARRVLEDWARVMERAE